MKTKKAIKVLKFVAKTSFKAGVVSAVYLVGHSKGYNETKNAKK